MLKTITTIEIIDDQTRKPIVDGSGGWELSVLEGHVPPRHFQSLGGMISHLLTEGLDPGCSGAYLRNVLKSGYGITVTMPHEVVVGGGAVVGVGGGGA